MLEVNTSPLFKRFGDYTVPVIKGNPRKAENFVTKINPTSMDEVCAKFTKFKTQAQEMAQKLNIPFKDAVKQLQQEQGHLVDIYA